MPRSRAEQARSAARQRLVAARRRAVIIMRFTDDGEIDAKLLTDDPGIVAPYRKWRDLAVRNATPAEEIAAA